MSRRRVANLSVATDKSNINNQTGERVDTTKWHRIISFLEALIDMFEKLSIDQTGMRSDW